MHVSHLSLLLSSYGYFYAVVCSKATFLVATVALRCVTCVRCVRGLETGPWRSPAWTPGLSGRSQLCRSSCLPWCAVHYYNSALHGTADKATCIAAIYQTDLESMQAAWLLHSASGLRVGVVVD